MTDHVAMLEKRLLVTQQQLANALARCAELEAIILLSAQGTDNE